MAQEAGDANSAFLEALDALSAYVMSTVTSPTEALQSVSVVVVNHNAGRLLLDCVSASLEQASEVIVVDNCSTDGSMNELIAVLGSNPNLVTLLSKVNNGFSAGCNLGIALARFPQILFMNPDCVLSVGALTRLSEVLMAGGGVGMVGGRLVNPDGSEQGGGRRAVPTPWRSFVRAFGLNRWSQRWPKLFFDFYLHEQPLPKNPIEVEAISGALMLVSKAAIQDVGLWDEAYFLHCEDLDWCMRFRIKGWRILFVPDVEVLHYQGHSSRLRPLFVEWHKHKGMLRFYRKFFSHQYPGILMWLVRLGVWFRFSIIVGRYWLKVIWARLSGEHG